MNATIVTRLPVAPQPKVITGIAWAMGFEDGCQGKSIYMGYHLFCGPKLCEYKRGWAEGHNLVTDAYVPFQMPKEVYAAVQFAADREDWIGE